ncbi:efflux transporter outer membrane subunit [Rhodoplanes sp. TEM]|uniref:Efflux transporter outer membrane subunit n=1 Tax=Rhodoplanes tepidamans TaxID=200616 RepID=A0ABT5J8V6_RHOTP|nr:MULTISPECIES: efflux transporter outer membrane subunit [Rhodoplanes]MDC7785826.1 efflux transporter outer membrane subunit [Rhodoplanes tepidamans]MDC7984093.1 efflux transporter outer membrane subunit [Rhodoplanes sp. TEM]MDQ0354610.1 NodT family efflux transporter outer membrane factor (OMF) lipoprotein [Rhodoplanes tepidamans]
MDQSEACEGGRSGSGRAGRPTAIACLLALAPLLGACFVDTEKPELALDVPRQYKEGRGSAEQGPGLDWWRGFRSGELTVLMEEAQTSNLDIAAAVARIMQADAQARISGSALLPSLSGAGSATRTRTAGASTSSGVSSERSSYTTYLTASYELDFWGRNRATLLAAQESAVATRFDRDTVALTAMANVATYYFQLLAAQDRLRIGRDNLAASSRILALIKERFAAGTANSLDVSQQESLVATVRANLPAYEITIRQNAAYLAVLVGRTPEHFAVKGGTLDKVAVPRIPIGLPSDLINQRPDIRAAEASLVSANHSVEAARASFFPTIGLTAQNGVQSAALSSLFGPGAWFYTATASLTQPIFDGGNLQGQLEQTQGRQLELLQTYRQAVINGFADVERALVSLHQQTERERLQAVAVRTAREAFQISESRLREGIVDYVTVLNTQQTLFTAQDTLVQVRLARMLAAVSLFQALGGGWPPRIGGNPA